MSGKGDLPGGGEGRGDGRDYKADGLRGNSRDRVQDAMRDGEYDRQGRIDAVARHGWLRCRLGRAYDYARDMGGIRYLFCRGLDGNGNGVHVDRFAPALVDGLDALFAGGEAAQADLVARAIGASA